MGKMQMQGGFSGSGGSPKDFIGMNKQVIPQWSQFKDAKKYHIQDETALKVILAKQKKDVLEEERRKKNLFQLYKWELVRQKVGTPSISQTISL